MLKSLTDHFKVFKKLLSTHPLQKYFVPENSLHTTSLPVWQPTEELLSLLVVVIFTVFKVKNELPVSVVILLFTLTFIVIISALQLFSQQHLTCRCARKQVQIKALHLSEEQVMFAGICNSLGRSPMGCKKRGGGVWKYVFIWKYAWVWERERWSPLTTTNIPHPAPSHSPCSPLFACLIRPAVPPHTRSQFVVESCCVCSQQDHHFPRLHVWSTPCVAWVQKGGLSSTHTPTVHVHIHTQFG